MVKLTVIYDLLPDADHGEFIRKRTTKGQAENMSHPGVVKSDFYVIEEGWPDVETPYRYITESYYTDMETFRRGFFKEEFQADLRQARTTVGDIIFFISEEVISGEAE